MLSKAPQYVKILLITAVKCLLETNALNAFLFQANLIKKKSLSG